MTTADASNKDLFFVAVKAFLVRRRSLFVFKDRFGDWDLPGGRLTTEDFATPLELILQRKIRQELGDGVSYTLGAPAALMRHERLECAPGRPKARIFAIGYEARFEAGEIQLSDQHVESRWIDMETCEPRRLFTGGWLTGVQEFLHKWRSGDLSLGL